MPAPSPPSKLMNNPVFSANVSSCTGFLKFEMPVYSIEAKCVKRF
ncbi:hypothetical protein AGRO_5218 [Agrobacterium sp. ATCC 31749]|nr:hypothetical protein AGRO_5218 [Agrobacterium sp. ATCC 31749]